MRTKIYTKGGDRGQTSLFGGARVDKNDSRLEAYGTLDELNANLGFVVSQIENFYSHSRPNDSGNDDNCPVAHPLQTITSILRKTQNSIFDMASHLALNDEAFRKHLAPVEISVVADMELAIDEMDNAMPELKTFILPGGTETSARLHLARTVCRRAERIVSAVLAVNSGTDSHQQEHFVDAHTSSHIMMLLNRLSDFLFVASRYANFVAGRSDTKWQKRPASPKDSNP
jgi:cob(I)alamin adenosyltransferase